VGGIKNSAVLGNSYIKIIVAAVHPRHFKRECSGRPPSPGGGPGAIVSLLIRIGENFHRHILRAVGNTPGGFVAAPPVFCHRKGIYLQALRQGSRVYLYISERISLYCHLPPAGRRISDVKVCRSLHFCHSVGSLLCAVNTAVRACDPHLSLRFSLFPAHLEHTLLTRLRKVHLHRFRGGSGFSLSHAQTEENRCQNTKCFFHPLPPVP